QIVQGLTTTQFVSSPIPGINGGDFSFLWNFALAPVFAQVVRIMGGPVQTINGKRVGGGVALPRIPPFNFVADDTLVTLAEGYVAVLANVQHPTDLDRLYYWLSKPMVNLSDFPVRSTVSQS